jgi:beta-glucanase (GH16 family)
MKTNIVHWALFCSLISATWACGDCLCNPTPTTASGAKAPLGRLCSGQLIFEENFDKFDLTTWEHEQTLGGGGNWEFQWYTNNRSNSYAKDGVLFIRPTLTSGDFGEEFIYSGTLDIEGGTPYEYCTNRKWWGCSRTGNQNNIVNPVKSARIRTINSFAFKYGKVEVRAKLPTGDWLWPAIWMMPKMSAYSGWPSSGEIDIMESRGNEFLTEPNGRNVGVEQVGSTLHYGPFFDIRSMTGWTRNSAAGQGYNKGFHKYSVEWTPEKFVFSVDDVVLGELAPPAGGFWERENYGRFPGIDNPWEGAERMAPFDQEFYIIMNLAVGGVNGYFGDHLSNNGRPKPWSNGSPVAMKEFWESRREWLPTWKLDQNHSAEASLQVDYVKVWAI